MISHDAIVHEDCFIGGGTRIWQFASILRGACVGANSSIGSSAVVDGCLVGHHSSVGAGAQIHPGVAIYNRVFIGPGVIFCNDVWPRVDKEGFDTKALFNRERFISIVESDASVGARAVILPGTHIGSFSMVAAGAVCSGVVPDRHLFKRDGTIVPMPEDLGASRRMRFAEL